MDCQGFYFTPYHFAVGVSKRAFKPVFFLNQHPVMLVDEDLLLFSEQSGHPCFLPGTRTFREKIACDLFPARKQLYIFDGKKFLFDMIDTVKYLAAKEGFTFRKKNLTAVCKDPRGETLMELRLTIGETD